MARKGLKVFFGNYKGGVAKTTSTFNMAVELAKHFKKKVLIIDLDPQSSLSEVCMTAFKTDGRLDELEKEETLNYIYTVYMQARRLGNIKFTVPSDKIIKIAHEVAFIPNNLFSELGGLDRISMDIGNNLENLLILRDFIEENGLDLIYDFIFFDCPPSNNLITQSAFLYSDYYIIPTIMDPLSVKGVKHYISVIQNIYDSYCRKNTAADILSLIFGDEPKLIGVFETMRKGNTNNETHRISIKDTGHYLFNNEIKDRKDVSETMGIGSEANNYEYRELTDEFLKRISELEG